MVGCHTSQTPTNEITSAHAAAIVDLGRTLQAEARTFGDDLNESYLMVHGAIAEALRDRANADPHSLSQALRTRARRRGLLSDLLEPKSNSVP